MQRPSSHSGREPNPVLTYLRERHGAGSWITLETFVEAALYAPDAGYYRRQRQRVGKAGGDFYTATSMGAVFGQLVMEAARRLVEGMPDRHTFVEVGAEPGGGIAMGLEHPFAAARTLRWGDLLSLEGRCVVFSNELFDAQPFRRFRREEGQWKELGLDLGGAELQLAPMPQQAPHPADLPIHAPEGYELDYPSGARTLARSLVSARWSGLFIAFDYGLNWDTITTERPAGTGRTYRGHRQDSNLLAEPGAHDITHHVCWDHLAAELKEAGFEAVEVVSQEAFFMRHAIGVIAEIIEKDPGGLHPERQRLKELLHPGNMGRKFQVLYGVRREPPGEPEAQRADHG